MNTVCVPRVYKRLELGETETKSSIVPITSNREESNVNLNKFDLDKLNAKVNQGVTMLHSVIIVTTTIKEIMPDNDRRKVIVITNIDLVNTIIISFGTPPVYSGTGVGLITDQGVPLPAGKSILLPKGSAPINRIFAGSDAGSPKLSVLEGI